MKKHFMCTHAFFDDDARQAFEDASIGMTDRQIFEMMKGEKAEMLGHWRGNEIDAIMDSSVQRGTHIIKALSLGAKAVGLGRNYLFPVNGGLKPCQCGGAKVGHFMSRLGA